MKLDVEILNKILTENLYDGVYLLDTDRKITFWNRAAERITGYSGSEVIGTKCSDNILIHVDEDGHSLCVSGCPVQSTITDGNTREVFVYLHHKDGHRVPVFVRTSPIRDKSGNIIGAVEIFSENVSQKSLREKIIHMEELAMLDSLTEMPNRRFLETAIESRFDEMRRYGWNFGLLIVDIDFFKKVNDTYGHDVGDMVLRMVGKTLTNSARVLDVVGRWGGEEFLAVIANIGTDELMGLGNRFKTMIEQSKITTINGTVGVTVSIGAALAEPDDSAESLLKKADEKLYEAKNSGRNSILI